MRGKERVCNAEFLQKKEKCKCNSDCWLVKLGWQRGLGRELCLQSRRGAKNAFIAYMLQTKNLQVVGGRSARA